MKRFHCLLLVIAMLSLGSHRAGATTVIGDINNFDTLNDTGQTCYGFEIEIDDVHSTGITYTFDWNHYGTPKIFEDNTDPAHPKALIRYESVKDASGNWGANGTYTNQAIPSPNPPTGHTCTNTAVNEGCEHFGVGYYGATAAVRYYWLVDGGAGTLVRFGSPVAIGKPAWTYTPPAGQPAQVVAVIPAPVVPIPPAKQFGEPSFVKVVKTTTHNANPVALQDLISDDANGDGLADWQNGEPDEVETEWKLLQTNTAGNVVKEALEGLADDMGDGSENVTRRYEFYGYGAAADTRDGETGEAMCDEVQTTTDPANPLYRHGVGTAVAVTDPNGDTYYVNCEAQVVIGDYIGAQMAGFDAEAELGLIDHLQDGEKDVAYTARTVVVGGNSPYTINITQGSLPPGMSIGDYLDPQTSLISHGVLSGTPTAGGDFLFTVEATDSSSVMVSGAYTVHIAGPVVQQFQLTAEKLGTGAGTVAGNGIDCGANCSVWLDPGTPVSLTATPAAGSVFSGWSGPCAGTADCTFTLNASSTVQATFTQTQQWLLSVTKAGGGTGTVTSAPAGIDCGATCSASYDSSTLVTLTAAASGNSTFTGWSGSGCSGTGTCQLTMDAAKDVTATFELQLQSYDLSVSKSGLGTGTVTSSPAGIDCGATCSASYVAGTPVTLTGVAATGSIFTGWTASGCSGTGTCQVTMDAAKSVKATFVKKPCGSIGSANGSAGILLGILAYPALLRRRLRRREGGSSH